ncbi:MAG: hypothetical protein K2L86_16895 [Lachnospiraceae bacterium]|nr:hypothetical protein [Lachnospiraceae bacterium]
MKKSVAAAVTAGVLMAGGIGGWQGHSPGQEAESPVESLVNEIGTQAAEEFKKVFTQEVSAFFKSDDLEKTLGIDRDGQASIEAAIKAYIRDYDLDEEKLDEAKASLQTLLENTEGLTAEELQDRISKIFGNKNGK